MAPKRIPIPIRIIEKVSKEGGACWLWSGCCGNDGYGVMGVGRKQKRVHRMAYECFVGPIPDGMLVCHTCDVPRCVNPDHLFLGTPKDNTADMVKKGRKPIVSRDLHHNSKLTSDQVKDLIRLRDSGKKLQELASVYGISFGTVSQIYLKEAKSGTGNI